MLIASLHNIAHHFGGQDVLRDVTLEINSGQKLGLIGSNGAGKTTLVRILLGDEQPARGTVFLADGIRVGYLPQHLENAQDATVLDYLLSRQRHVSAQLRRAEEALSTATDGLLDKASREYQRARDEYDRIDGDLLPQRAASMLDSMGIGHKGDQAVESLSGGERSVLSLARALLDEPEFLVLDEPANHLDYLSVVWLEDFLNRFKGAVLVVSHNRYLLDRVVDGIVELDSGRCRYYDGGYSEYRAGKLQDLLAQQSDYLVQQKRLAQLTALVQKFEVLASAHPDPKWGKRLRARRSQLAREQSQAIDRPTIERNPVRARFEADRSQANIALQLRGYTKAFGELVLLRDVSLDIAGGERVALVGPNGCGKTSLLEDIVGTGAWENLVVRVGRSMNIGYSPQEQKGLVGNERVMESIRTTAPISEGDALSLIARFGFTKDDSEKKISNLSGGEKNRLHLARLMLLKPNFLILDEPTNHLDILSREAVEEALEDFKGTILVVSHDRYFLDKVANRVVEVEDGQLTSYPGNFTEFWLARRKFTPRTALRKVKVSRPRQRRRNENKAPSKPNDGNDVEGQIREAETEKLELEHRMAEAFAKNDYREGRKVERRLKQVNAVISDLYDKWNE